ncbi:MAG: GntR family transcriptional regulator [Clostridiales bacterium]|nr:GntR family transcriptional regulator [Clostridiales bacterium]
MKVSKQVPGENSRMYAHRVILENIINLELPPGSAVSEKELSLALNLSRTPVREALIEMSRLGLVEIVPQRGSYVTKIDYDLIDEVKFIRLSLELSVTKLACKEGISEESIGLLHSNMKEQRVCLESGSSAAELMELDNQFHKLLFQAVGKPRAYDFVQGQMFHFDRLRMFTFEILGSEKSSQTVNDHENIIYALEKRDWDLMQMVMTCHLSRHLMEKDEVIKYHPEYFV